MIILAALHGTPPYVDAITPHKKFQYRTHQCTFYQHELLLAPLHFTLKQHLPSALIIRSSLRGILTFNEISDIILNGILSLYKRLSKRGET